MGVQNLLLHSVPFLYQLLRDDSHGRRLMNVFGSWFARALKRKKGKKSDQLITSWNFAQTAGFPGHGFHLIKMQTNSVCHGTKLPSVLI